MSPVASAVVGVVSALFVLLAGKAVDLWAKSRARELDIASIVGELRAGFSAQLLSHERLESRVDTLSKRIDKLDSRLADIAEKLDEHEHHDYHLVAGGEG